MSRKPIQVPTELKERIERKKERMRIRTEYDVIETLLDYHEQKENHAVLDDEVRDQLDELMNKLHLRERSDLIKLLLHHYQTANGISKESFELYASMRSMRW